MTEFPSLLRMMLGDTADGPYVHTFTPDPAPYYETDAEEMFAEWFVENDPWTSTLDLLGAPASISFDIDPDGYPWWTYHYEIEARP